LGGCQAAQSGVATAQKTVSSSVHSYAPSPVILILFLHLPATTTGKLAAIPGQKRFSHVSVFEKACFSAFTVAAAFLRNPLYPHRFGHHDPDT